MPLRNSRNCGAATASTGRRKPTWLRWPELPGCEAYIPTKALDSLVILCAGRKAKYMFLRHQDIRTIHGRFMGEQEIWHRCFAPEETPQLHARFRSGQDSVSMIPSVIMVSDSNSDAHSDSGNENAVVIFQDLHHEASPGAKHIGFLEPRPPGSTSTEDAPYSEFSSRENHNRRIRKAFAARASSQPNLQRLKNTSPAADSVSRTRRSSENIRRSDSRVTNSEPTSRLYLNERPFSQNWNLPSIVITTTNMNDPQLQRYLRKNKISARLRPDMLAVGHHIKASSTGQVAHRAMDHLMLRPSCKIDAEFIGPQLLQQKVDRMETANLPPIPDTRRILPQAPVIQAKRVMRRRSSSDKQKVRTNAAVYQRGINRFDASTCENNQIVLSKKAAPSMERTHKHRPPKISIVPSAPTARPNNKNLEAFEEDGEEWDPKWVVEQPPAVC